MSDWSMGYQTDLQYTFGYYREINPLYARYLLTTQGFDTPDFSQGCACELGFGQGVSITMHAAGSTTKWYGNDFNPAQVNYAQHLAKYGKVEVMLSDESFGDFADRDDLPMFDFICLHGIWSWISPENQNYIIEFARRHLKIGGIFYISYNVSPGFIAFEPVRHLMSELNKHMLAGKADVQDKLAIIKQYLEQIVAVEPSFIKVMPGVAKRIEDTLTKDYHYLVGEYLNSFWDITHHSVLCERLQAAKLDFACSATGTELMDSLNLTAEQQQFLAQFKGGPLYESSRDFIVNQQFRRDFFIKGPRKLTKVEHVRRYNELALVLIAPGKNVTYEVKTRLGTASLIQEIYKPLVEFLDDNEPHTIGQLKEHFLDNKKFPQFTEAKLLEAINTLVFTGTCAPAVMKDTIDPKSIKQCLDLNLAIINETDDSTVNFLASPVLQGGVIVGDVGLKALQVYLNNNRPKDKKVLINCLLDYFADTDHTLNKEGKPVTDRKEQKEIVSKLATRFYEDQLKVYQNLMLI